jgi:hypothetical protein
VSSTGERPRMDITGLLAIHHGRLTCTLRYTKCWRGLQAGQSEVPYSVVKDEVLGRIRRHLDQGDSLKVITK